jgi:uncharacterized protein DUF992
MLKALAAAAALLAAWAAPAAAQQAGVELGTLDCAIGGGTGFIFGSKKDLHCTFTSLNQTFAPEAYFGVVSKWGLDIGSTDGATMRWLVLAPSNNIYAPGALAGDYVGASAEVTASVGAGANLLVGGLGNTFTLQPLSVQTQTGLNLALGVTRFQLRSSGN